MVPRVEISRIAELLRQARERRGLTMEQAATAAGVPLRYARLLEGDAGAGVGISDELYLVPFFRRYAAFVGLNAEQLLPDFLGHVQEVPGTAPPPAPLTYPSRMARLWKPAAASAAVAAAVFLIVRQSPERPAVEDVPWDEPEVQATRAPGAVAAAREDADVATASAPAEIAAADPRTEAAAHAVASPSSNGGDAALAAVNPERAAAVRELRITATEETWIALAIDAAPKREFILRPGEARTWTANESFTLTVGNAGGITITLDGRELPRLGSSGQVVRSLRLPESGARAPSGG